MNRATSNLWVVVAAAVSIAAGPARLPEPAPAAPQIAPPRDVPFPGVIDLDVDATDLAHGVFAVRETVPVTRAGPLVLLYPEWLPGNHSPTGQIDRLAGIEIRAGGARLAWRRDPVDMYALHVNVPSQVRRLDVAFDFLSPVSPTEGRVMMSPDMLDLQWSTVVLYPAGFFARRIMVAPAVRLPAGFSFATALGSGVNQQARTRFPVVPLNRLVDSPLIAGRWFKSFDLDPGGVAPVRLEVVADRPDELNATDSEIAAHRALVAQAYRLFGARHYGHYDFLLWLSDRLGGEGLEHHQSSEDGSLPGYFTHWNKSAAERDLLPHEYTHSWNGKYRRPADLWTANFNTPMRDSLLWVYEGQTQYWGFVLAARAGLLTKAQALDALALVAATFDHRPGRAWRDLEDTTAAPIIAMRRPQPWISWQRSEDYYSEGQLIWLDVDTLIRKLSGGRRSLDDFARAFFGAPPTGPVTRTYDFEDIVAALDAVQPYDWAAFLHARLRGHGPGAPLDGIGRGGYRLVYTETETPYLKAAEQDDKLTDLTFSLGLTIGEEGAVENVLWDGPAFAAGLRAGAKLMAVNGEDYDADTLKEAITRAKTDPAPIRLLAEQNNRWRTFLLDWRGGLRYPHLEPIPGAPDRLGQILAPRK